MAANGYVVNADVTVTWDGVPARFMRGTIIDSPASGALVTALGSNITALPSQVTSDMGGVSFTVDRLEVPQVGKTPYNAGQV